MLEASMRSQGISRTDSNEKWATSWYGAGVQKKAELHLLGCVKWAAEVSGRASEPETGD